MWQSYNYKRGKLKLVKDLKNDSAYLRHSLIDIDEIENMSKVHTFLFRYTTNVRSITT